MVFVMAHYFHPDEKMSWKGLLGILSGICGIVVLFYDSLLSAEQSDLMVIYALCAMLLASLGYAAANILVKKYVFLRKKSSRTIRSSFFSSTKFFLKQIVPHKESLEEKSSKQFRSSFFPQNIVSSTCCFVVFFCFLGNLCPPYFCFLGCC